jgi:hypothetical protein
MGNKSGGSQRAQDYFGTIAGILCCGPIDFISGVVADNALIWPNVLVWPASRVYVHSKRIGSNGTHVGIQCQDPHGLAVGDHFTTWNFDNADSRLNLQLGTVLTVNDAWGFEFATPSGVGSFGVFDFTEGFISRVAPFAINDLTRIGPVVYQCTTNHSASLANMPGTPGGAAYWQQFRLSLSSNPTLEAEPGAPDGSSTYPVAQLTSESHGEIFIYQGTATQTLDTTLEKVLAQYGHPAYRDQVVVVLKNFFFGRESATAPNVSVIAGRTPKQTVITGASAALDADGQANPLCVLAELLTHPIWGLGLDPSTLDATSWQATADWLYGSSGANQGTFYISPLIDQQQNVRQLVADLLEHCDCWLRWNASGVIEAGHRLHNQAAPTFTNGVNVINYHDAIDGKEIGWGGAPWDDTFNKVTLHYSDRDHVWHTRPAIASAQWNRELTGRIKEQVIEAPHVCRADQALTLAAWRAKVGAEPGVTGQLTIRAETITARPGDPVQVTHDAVSATLPMIITERTWKAPPSGQMDLQVESIRGLSAVPFVPTRSLSLGSPQPKPAGVSDNYIAPGTSGSGAPTANSPVTPNYTFIQLPPVLWGNKDFELTLLAGRTSQVTRAYNVYYRLLDGGTFKNLERVTKFAVAGWVTASFAVFTDGSGNLVDNRDGAHDATQLAFQTWPLTPQADIDHISATPSADAIADNDLLAIIVKHGDPHTYEICTVKALTATGGGAYTAKLVRQVYGTQQGGNGSSSWTGTAGGGDWVFIIYRAELASVTSDSMASQVQNGSAITLRIAPESAWYAEDVGNLYDASLHPSYLTHETTYTWTDLFAPAASSWDLEILTGAHTGAYDHTVTYAGTDQMQITLVASAGQPSVALASVQIVAYGGGVIVPVMTWTNVAGASTQRLTSPTFTLASQGDYYLQATITDTHGRVTTAIYPTNYPTYKITIPAGGGIPQAPTASPPGVSFYSSGSSFPIAVTLSCSTGGSTCQYSVVPLGNGPGSWTTGTSVNVGANRTLWARSYVAGPVYSAQVSWDFRNRG